MPIYNPVIHQTSTLIVAASDSLYAERVDYTCDGTADDVEINAAFALGAADTRVVLLEGTYTLADSIIFTNNNQVLEGQGRGTFIDGDGLATTEHAIIATSLTNIVIKNLAIQTADTGGNTIHCIFLDNGCNDFLIDNVVIVDSDSDGIHVAGTNVVGGIIADCVIEDVDDHGIYFDMDGANTAARITIKNNRIAGAGSDGIYVGSTGAGSPYWTIEGNNIVNSGQNGMELQELTFATISGNVVHTSTFHGIILSTGSNNNNVENNQVYNNTRHGIGLVDSTENTLVGNTCNGNDSGNTNSYCGIHIQVCDYTTIVGNHCYDNDQHGIHIFRSSYCVVTGNNCHENTQGDGIVVVGDGTANADFNTISDNNASGNGSDGISVVGGTDANGNHITGNYVASNSVYGITVAGPDTKIEDNQIYHNGGGAAGNYHGIYLAGTSDRCSVNNNIIGDDGTDTEDGINLADGAINCQISGNYIYNLMGDGVRLMANNTSTVVHDNYCLTLDENGIAISDSVDCTVSGNHCENNTHHGIYLDNVDEANVSNNYCRGNDRLNAATYDGIYVDVDSSYVNIVGNHCTENDRYGIYVLSVTCELTANHALGNTTGQISVAAGTTMAHNETGATAEVHEPREATIVVAASDSLSPSADLVGDGTADDVQIQAAIDALPAVGGRVILLEGTFTLAADLTFPDDVTLEGQGDSTILNFGGASIANALTLHDNSKVKNLKAALVAGAGGGGTRPNVVYATGRTQILLENLWLAGDTSVADDGSDARQNGIYFDTVTESKIVKCRIEDNDRHGIHLNSSSDNIVSGNNCQDNTSRGILLTSSSNNNAITGNVWQGNGSHGFELNASLNNTVAGNACQGNGWHGINISLSSNNTVSENTCQGNPHDGIYLVSSHQNTITGNTCQGNDGYGIYLSMSDNNTITGNTYAENDSAGSTASGIYLGYSDENVVTGNQCSGNGLHGIYIYRSSYCAVSGNVCNNQNTGDGINVTGDATANADYNNLTGNTCYNNADDGIAIEGTTDANYNIVVSNQLHGNTGTNLVDNGTNTQLGHNQTV